jgi:uncharacterized protein (DUF1800 family)
MSQHPSHTPPSDPFIEYEPDVSETWDIRKAGHLLRRATFGASHERLDAMLKLSPRQAIDSLFDFDPQVDPFGDMVERMVGLVNLDSADSVQRWWIYRMLYSPQPAQEKLALFWHNRFATSASKVTNGQFMAKQVELFRQQGLGSFRDLAIAVGRDPAMLMWLDGQHSRRGTPNENYARELMELFTLGVGNFTEHDVRELARAFTGWQIRDGKGVLEPKHFDDGEKTIFGATSKFDSESAVDLILKQPSAPNFLARKLLREFVHPHPTDEMIDHYAGRLVEHQWQIKPVLKELFASRLFFSDWSYRSRIKSPAELAIGGSIAVGGKVNVQFVRDSMNRMGQSLLFPPNVKGWDGEEAWINANTVLVRFNYGMALATQREFARRTDVEADLTRRGITEPDAIIEHFARVLLDGNLPQEARSKFLDYMARGEKGEVRYFKLNPGTVNSKVRGLIHLMMATPEFQLA